MLPTKKQRESAYKLAKKNKELKDKQDKLLLEAKLKEEKKLQKEKDDKDYIYFTQKIEEHVLSAITRLENETFIDASTFSKNKSLVERLVLFCEKAGYTAYIGSEYYVDVNYETGHESCENYDVLRIKWES